MSEKIRSNGRIKYLVLMWVILVSYANYGQQYYMESGRPFIQNFTPNEYKAHNQNFSVVSDLRNIMYFGNFAGILEFDGSNWQIIQTHNKSRVTVLKTDEFGRLLVGSYKEFGILQPNELGRMEFVSLSQNLSIEHKNFDEVLNILIENGIVWFVTESFIFAWDNISLKAFEPETNIISAYSTGGSIFCLLKQAGLCELDGDKFIPVPGGGLFSETVELKAIFNPGNDTLIFATSNRGLFKYNRNEFIPFSSTLNSYFKEKIISCGCLQGNRNMAIGTERGGIVILYPNGQLKEIITERAGLNDNYVRHLYEHNGALWAALNNGITRIETPSPITFYNIQAGLNGGVTDIIRHKNQLYIATYNGLFYQDSITAFFRQINDIKTGCWSLVSTADNLLAATSAGIFIIDENSAKKISNHFALKLHAEQFDLPFVYAGHADGLAILEKINQKWTIKDDISISEDEIRDICGGGNESLWLTTPSDGLYRYFTEGSKIEKFDTTNGLPSLMMNRMNETSHGLVVTAIDGLYAFDEQRFEFGRIHIPTIDSSFNTSWHTRIYEDKRGNIWSCRGDETHIARYILYKGKYTNSSVPLAQIKNTVIWSIYSDFNGVMWFGGPDGLIRFDTNIKLSHGKEFYTLIRKVITVKDSVLFHGNFMNENNTVGLVQNPFHKSMLEFENNKIQFEFSASAYQNKVDLKYQYQLGGFEDEWSDWISTNKKEYTNLPPGEYVFSVRAKDVFGNVSHTASYEFFVLTPWYMKWWAFVLYIVLIIVTIGLIAYWRSQKLVKEKKRLESLIKERTTEIIEQKEEIENQSQELSNKNKELERINMIVKAINSEIAFNDLLEAILEKTRLIKAVERVSALVYDKSSDSYKFKASFGLEKSSIENAEFTLAKTDRLFLKHADEIYEDIFFTNLKVQDEPEENQYTPGARCRLIIVVRIKEQVAGFLILENIQKQDAFTEEDFSFVKNLKEHIISAFIKTQILEDLQKTLVDLQETQEELIRQEKLASVGQLTKGIVDRVINPLNYINNFSNLSSDMILEIKELIEEERQKLMEETYNEIEEIASHLSGNLNKIMKHGESAARIVKGMEKLLMDKSNNYIVTEINNLLDKKIDLSIKELKADYNNMDVEISKMFDKDAGSVNLMHEEFGQVIKLLLDNAYYILREKAGNNPGLEMKINIITIKSNNWIEIRIRDNGNGIPASEIDKIFDPFFTTKPTSDGIGIGLYMCKDIIEAHNGFCKVNSNEGEYTEFILGLPPAKLK